jgi:hypothetical protein
MPFLPTEPEEEGTAGKVGYEKSGESEYAVEKIECLNQYEVGSPSA